MSDTVWMKLECGGGARWISTTEDSVGEVCNFLGCNCGTTVRKVGTTKSREEASNWFAPSRLRTNHLLAEDVVKLLLEVTGNCSIKFGVITLEDGTTIDLNAVKLRCDTPETSVTTTLLE